MGGISRRDLLKRSAIAGGVIWATPVLTSGTAWGVAGTCDCEGSPVYTKIAGVAGNDAQTCNNQCLNPDNLPSFGFGGLQDHGYVATTVTSGELAAVEFQSKSIFLNRLAMKVSESCYMITCVEQFGTVFTFANADQNEPKNVSIPDQTPALFTFADGDGTNLGDSNNGVPAGTKVRKIGFHTEALLHKVNFVEFILCVENLSRIPCTTEDC
jgi:hypothetical protein